LIVLGIDPGTRKCGLALIDATGGPPAVLEIVPLDGFGERLAALVAAHPIGIAAIGRGTNAATIVMAVQRTGLAHVLVDERETTLRARARFFADHPPRGWRRLVPRGMLLPDRPIDDYAALLIAERYLARVAEPAGAGRSAR
jgi:RNase H-fold protein (predicted Holliday junction resolvase)